MEPENPVSPRKAWSWSATGIFLASWLVYLATGCWQDTPYDAHVHQAWAFLHGRADLIDPPAYFETVRLGDRTHMAYGVSPSFLMLPFVVVWGLAFHQPAFNAALGALAVTFWWVILGRVGTARVPRIWLTSCFGAGSLFWYYAGENGNTWSLMHVTAVTCVLGAMAAALRARGAFLAGLGMGLAILARQAELLALPFMAGLVHHHDGSRRRMLAFGTGLGLVIAAGALYNAVRFGSPLDNGYERVIRATTEPGLLPHGLFHPAYVARNAVETFLRLPERVAGFPGWSPTLDGFSVLIGWPALMLLLLPGRRAQDEPVPAVMRGTLWLAAFTCLGIIGLYLAYYWSGYAQFGRRYSVDWMPFALWLLAARYRHRADVWLVGATLLGLIVELWGISWWQIHRW